MNEEVETGRLERGIARIGKRQGASSESIADIACQPPRANRRNDLRSSWGMLKMSASCSTTSTDGWRSSDSNLRKALVEQLSCKASCSCVSPNTCRRRLSHSPNATSANLSSIDCVTFVSVSVAASDTYTPSIPRIV